MVLVVQKVDSTIISTLFLEQLGPEGLFKKHSATSCPKWRGVRKVGVNHDRAGSDGKGRGNKDWERVAGANMAEVSHSSVIGEKIMFLPNYLQFCSSLVEPRLLVTDDF